jgi:hypothetical protein
MGTYPQIKFYRGTKTNVEAQSPAKGSIWFNTANGSINIKGDTTWESYSGYRDVSFANGVLTFTKADGTTKTVTLSGFVSATDFSNFQTTYNNHLTAQSEKDADQDTNISKNAAAIADMLGDDKNADGSPTTSIRQIVIDELSNQLLAGGEDGETAGESFETLKELADWLEQHPDDAGALNSTVNDHTTAIDELKTDVSDLETAISTINTTVEENELTTAAALTNLDQRVITIEGSAITSVTGSNYITATTTNGAVEISATTGTLDGNTNGLALAADVKQYVDSL